MVSPSEDMVVVFTASIQGYDYHPHQELFLDYILDAIIGEPRSVQSNNTSTPTVGEFSELIGAGLLFSMGVFVVTVLFIWKEKWRIKSSS